MIVLVLAAVGVVGWSLSHQGHGSGTAQPTTGASSSSAPSAAASHILRPVSANSFDALGDDGGNEDGSSAKYALGISPGQFWHTDYYDNYPQFGNLKKGTGLILDMGEQVQLSQVVVQFGTSCCAHVQIEIGNDDNPVPSALATFTPVQSNDHVSGSTTFDVTSKTTGRYVLIWITYLPPLTGSAGRIPGADLRRGGAWFGREPVGLMPRAARRRTVALGRRTPPPACGRGPGGVRRAVP